MVYMFHFCMSSAGIRLCEAQSLRYENPTSLSPLELFQIQVPQLCPHFGQNSSPHIDHLDSSFLSKHYLHYI